MYQVRDGKRVKPTCPTCGCRLGQFEDMWYHFYGDESHDARGDICPDYQKGFDFSPKVLDNDYSYSVV
jgi:hypothetical protein